MLMSTFRLLGQGFDVAPPSAWSTLYAILEAVDAICATFSQLWLVVSMVNARDGGWTLMLVCFAKVFTDMVMMDQFRPRCGSLILIRIHWTLTPIAQRT